MTLNYLTLMFVRFFRSPAGIISGVVAGALTGHFFPTFGQYMGGFGTVFVSLMKMCIIPIIVTSISLSLSTFLSTKMPIGLKRILPLFALIVIMTSVIGVATAYITQPGYKLDTSASPTLKAVSIAAAQIDRAIDDPLEVKVEKGIVKFFLESVPSNIFDSVSEDRFFQITVFSFIFGISLAFIIPRFRNTLQPLLESICDVFDNIFNAIIIVLPLAIFLIMAHDVQEVGTDTLLGMSTFVMSAYLAMLVLFIVNSIIIMIRTNTSFIKSFSYLKNPLFIAIATHSGVAAIPAAITALSNNFKLNKKIVGLLVPIGTILGQYGTVVYFSFAAVFIAQFYGMNLEFNDYIFITMMAIMAALSSIGASGTIQLPLLAIILDPLGLPITAILVLLIAVDAIMDIGMSFMRVHTNCAAVILIAPKPKSIS